MKVLKILSLIISLSTSLSLQAASVWKVSDGKNTMYFGGTVHILKSEHLPLPIEYEKAYEASDKLVFETDIEGLQDAGFQQKLMAKMVLSDGSSLQTRLDEQTYSALKTYMDAQGLPIERFHTLKPSLVALTITVLEYQKNGFDQEGVDRIFATKAKADKKGIEWLESVDEQIDFIVNLGGDDENAMISYTIDELDTLPKLLDDMLLAWRQGNRSKLDEILIKEMRTNSPKMYQDLIVKRNRNWMPKILAMLKDKPTEFVLVGAGHFAGKDSVFAMLEAQGYKVEKVK
jgi:uncharacterized protein YbaP (TraB family)